MLNSTEATYYGYHTSIVDMRMDKDITLFKLVEWIVIGCCWRFEARSIRLARFQNAFDKEDLCCWAKPGLFITAHEFRPYSIDLMDVYSLQGLV